MYIGYSYMARVKSRLPLKGPNGIPSKLKLKFETKIHCRDRWKIREFYFCLTVTKIIVSGWDWSSSLAQIQGGRSNLVSPWFISDHSKSNLSRDATSSCLTLSYAHFVVYKFTKIFMEKLLQCYLVRQWCVNMVSVVVHGLYLGIVMYSPILTNMEAFQILISNFPNSNLEIRKFHGKNCDALMWLEIVNS